MSIELPSVTTILSPWSDYSKVSTNILEAAQERGSTLHEIWAAIGLNQRWLVEVPDSLSGYVASFQSWFDKIVVEVVLVEETLVDKTLGFQGTPDFVGRIKGDAGLALIDWKSGQTLQRSWPVQTSAYKHLAEKNGYPIARTGVLIPRPDGKLAKFKEYTRSLVPDFHVFRSALIVWKHFNPEPER